MIKVLISFQAVTLDTYMLCDSVHHLRTLRQSRNSITWARDRNDVLHSEVPNVSMYSYCKGRLINIIHREAVASTLKDFVLCIDQMYRLSCQQLLLKAGAAKALWIFNAIYY